MFENFRVFETDFAGRPLMIETGKDGAAGKRRMPGPLRRHRGACAR